MSRRVYVDVSGGVVDEVIVPLQTDGTWTVIDCDNSESDPAHEFGWRTRRELHPAMYFALGILLISTHKP